MKHHNLTGLAFAIVLPLIAAAQTPLPKLPAPPVEEAKLSVPAPTPIIMDAKPVVPSSSPVAAGAAQSPSPAPSPVIDVRMSSPAPENRAAPSPSGDIRLNFQNASLGDVLNYLSEAAGFIVLQEAPVTGTITVVSKQSMTADEAVDLLNSVLAEKGYTAIRNGRILKIVSRTDAQKKDLPVMAGSDPSMIPRKDQVVTQILPVRYLEVAKLVENLRPLLSADATISANESSNAILLADTQTNIHRIAEIIHALDTSISSISTIRVFPLQYADSKSLAGVLTQLFTTDQSRGGNGGPPQGGFGRRGGFLQAMLGGGGGNQPSQSPAQQAATRVIAVSDDPSNSVIVSAPDDTMTTIAEIVNRLDTNIADITETRIFRLEHADSMELANVIGSLYGDASSSISQARSGNGGNNFGPRPQPQSSTTPRSDRALLQSRVVAVPDPRTNSLVISAARDTMTQIALTVGRLDTTDSKKQHVYIYRLENADPTNVATILRGMFSSQNGSSSTAAQPSSDRLNQRTSTGASSEVTNTMSNTGGGSRASGF